MATSDAAPTKDGGLAKIAVLFAVAALAVMVVLAAIDYDGPVWLLQPIFGLAAVAAGWRAGGTSPRNPLAFGALIVGTLMTLIFLGWVVAQL